MEVNNGVSCLNLDLNFGLGLGLEEVFGLTFLAVDLTSFVNIFDVFSISGVTKVSVQILTSGWVLGIA
jgi:hypothetical protein